MLRGVAQCPLGFGGVSYTDRSGRRFKFDYMAEIYRITIDFQHASKTSSPELSKVIIYKVVNDLGYSR